MKIHAFCLLSLLAVQSHAAMNPPAISPHEGDWIDKNFHFKSGATLPELRLHYRTLGSPTRNSAGEITNAILILHSTGSSSEQFMKPQFAQVLFGKGQALDQNRYYIVMPDSIGHGRSSKPSDGLGPRFPAYDYDDMVLAQYDLLTKGLGIAHLRLLMGTSMGCMHSWVWAESYPKFMDGVMPLGCLPVPIAGRNRMIRQMMVQAIHRDVAWNGGNYTQEPEASLRIVAQILMIASSGAQELQEIAPDPKTADKYLADATDHKMEGLDANDLIFALDSSRNYDPSPRLSSIVAPMIAVNSADDFINPPELHIAEPMMRQVKGAKFVLIPVSNATHGHLTHTWAIFWQQYLRQLLEQASRG
jgi:homoserine O-acetyltransferase/O-succinyltransferase